MTGDLKKNPYFQLLEVNTEDIIITELQLIILHTFDLQSSEIYLFASSIEVF